MNEKGGQRMRAIELMEGEERRQMEGDNTTPRTAAYEESMTSQISTILLHL